MSIPIATHWIDAGPRRRHAARVERFSRDVELLAHLDSLAVNEEEATQVVSIICRQAAVEPPRIRFHARRSPYTGQMSQPRWQIVLEHGESNVDRFERERRKRFEPNGELRIGRVVTLMTAAHELGHHLVFALDPPSSPSHGKQWVSRFDDAAEAIRALI